MNAISDGSGMDRLPRGPHSLTPQDVAANQRRRLVEALVELVEIQGYVGTPVADNLERAGVSRMSFYELFPDRDELLKAAFTMSSDTVFDQTKAAAEGAQSRGHRLEALMRTLCQTAYEQPGMMSLWSIEIAAAGSDGFELRAALMRRYLALIEECLRADGATPLPGVFALNLAGALHREINARIRDTRTQALPLLPSQLGWWALSYQPVPDDLSIEPAEPWPWLGPNGLAGGRAPGTLTLSPNGRLAPIGNTSPGFRAHAHRERVLDALAQLNTEAGYAALSSQAIIERAEIPANVFRDEFKSAEELFNAALELGHMKAQAVVVRARTTAPWSEGVREAVHAFLEFFASEPYFARLALVDAPFAQPRTARRTNEHAIRYAQLMFDGAPRRRRPPEILPEAIVHGLFELVYCHVTQDRLAELPLAAAQATYLALAPFVGVRDAGKLALRQ